MLFVQLINTLTTNITHEYKQLDNFMFLCHYLLNDINGNVVLYISRNDIMLYEI